MQKFHYRRPRFPIHLPVKFIVPNSTLGALCTDISEEGLRLELLHPIQSGTCGTVSLCHRDQTLEFNVRVASVGATHAGLEFICASAAERTQVAQLVASLTGPPSRPALILLRNA
jgi:hypothetical protein